MATTVNRQVNIYIASGEAEKAYDRLISKEKSLKDELKKATDPAEGKKVTNQLKKVEEPIERAGKKLRGEVNPSMRDLQTTITKLQNQLKTKGIGDAEFTRLTVAVRKAKIEMAEAQKKMQQINSTASGGNVLTRTGSAIGNFSQNTFGVGIGAAGGALAAGAFLKTAVEEALNAEQAAARLKAQLDNLGKADAFDRLNESAENFAKQFSYIDNDDVLGVFEKLLTYGKLTEKEINDLTPVIIDFAAKQRITLEESSDVIIKALEGNGKALKTYGIDIKDAETTTERLGVVMTTLKGKVDGAAQAFSGTTEGTIATAKKSFNDLAETIGTKLLPALNGLIKVANFALIGLSDIAEKTGDAFNYVFNRAKYDADQMMRSIEEQQRATAQFAHNVASSYFNLSTDELRKKLESDLKLLRDVQKNHERELNLKKSGQDNISDYTANRIKEVEGIVKNTEAELQRRQEVIDRNRKENEEKTKAALEKDKANRQKAAEELNRVLQEIARKNEELGLYNSNQLAKDLARSDEYYDGLVIRAKGNKQLLLEIEDLRGREQALISKKYRDQWEREEIAAAKAVAKKKSDEQERLDRQRLVKLLQSQVEIATAVTEGAARAMGNAQASAELAVIRSRGKERLQAQQELLDLQEAQELAATDKTELEKQLIREKYDQRRAQLEVEFFQEQVKKITDLGSVVLQGLDVLFEAMNQRENAQLERDRITNEKKKENYKKQLDGKFLSQQEYDKKVAQIDKQQEAKEKDIKIKQFNRNKITSMGNAAISVAQGVAAALATPPAPNVGLAKMMAVLGLAQIALIAAQKPPKFARGGYLPGPSHSEGGMPVINPSTGRKVAEVEGGEVILSRSTVRNNGALVDQLLYSSLYKGGATINPAWKNASPSYLNIPMINSGIQRVRLFENGGVIPDVTSTAQDDGTMVALVETINALRAQISRGIKAYTVLSENEIQQQRMDNIRKESTFR